MASDIVKRDDGEVHGDLTVAAVANVVQRLDMIQALMAKAMREGTDYGQIPGTGSKPTLLKPGAEKLCLMFRLAPKYDTTKHFHGDGHMTVECTCKILDLAGTFLGEASAIASTRETKYAYRRAERVCPDCGKAAIIKGSAQYGGGWLCWKKKDGCGAKFADNDQRITGQGVGRVPNPDLADSYNTVLRIAEKRGLLGAVRLVTGSSALFDEEIPGQTERESEPEAPRQAPTSTQAAGPNPAQLKRFEAWWLTDPPLHEINERWPKLASSGGPTSQEIMRRMSIELAKQNYVFVDGKWCHKAEAEAPKDPLEGVTPAELAEVGHGHDDDDPIPF